MIEHFDEARALQGKDTEFGEQLLLANARTERASAQVVWLTTIGSVLNDWFFRIRGVFHSPGSYHPLAVAKLNSKFPWNLKPLPAGSAPVNVRDVDLFSQHNPGGGGADCQPAIHARFGSRLNAPCPLVAAAQK